MPANTKQDRKKTGFILLAFMVLVMIVLGSYSAQQQTQTSAQPQSAATQASAAPGKRVVMIIHGNLKVGTFWPVLIKGAEQAAKETGLILEVHDIELNNMEQMSKLIVEAVASKPDGIIITLPNAKALEAAVQKINDAQIPFIVINSGGKGDAARLGALTFIGQDEYNAGFAAGLRMADAGVDHAYCINHQPQNITVNNRCQGFIDAIQRRGGTVETLVVDKSDLPSARERILMALQLAPDTNGLLATTDLVAADSDLPIALEAIKESGIAHEVKYANFDFSAKTLETIQNGDMLFAIDQQQYLQGYLPMVILNLYFTNDNRMQDMIATGPSFITIDNVATVIKLTTAGTR